VDFDIYPPNKALSITVFFMPMKTLLLVTACFLPFPLMAQNTPPPLRPRPTVVTNPQAAGAEGVLSENIVIRLQGVIATGADIDLSLTGIGPKFTADQVVNDDTLLRCEYVVSETEKGYRVSYFVSVRIKVATQMGTNATNYEYRDVSTSGTALCVLGRPLVLVRNGPKPLQLTITKGGEQAGASEGDKPSD
jgi:hypothetical protein